MLNNNTKIFEELLNIKESIEKSIASFDLNNRHIEFIIHSINHYLINTKKIKEKEIHKISIILLEKFISKNEYLRIIKNEDLLLKIKTYSLNNNSIEYIVLNFEKFINNLEGI